MVHLLDHQIMVTEDQNRNVRMTLIHFNHRVQNNVGLIQIPTLVLHNRRVHRGIVRNNGVPPDHRIVLVALVNNSYEAPIFILLYYSCYRATPGSLRSICV